MIGLFTQCKELVSILEKQGRVLLDLEKLLQVENDCLSKFDRNGLDRCNEEMETLCVTMSQNVYSRNYYSGGSVAALAWEKVSCNATESGLTPNYVRPPDATLSKSILERSTDGRCR